MTSPAGSDQSCGTRTPQPVPSVLDPHTGLMAPGPAGSKAAAAGAFGAAARLWRCSTHCVYRPVGQQEMQHLGLGLVTGKKEQRSSWCASAQWDVHSRGGRNKRLHTGHPAGLSPTGTSEDPLGSQGSQQCPGRPHQHHSAARGSWNIVTKAPLYPQNHTLRR